jgi:2,3-bisphosphoglycerate-dependent phosphoglycerate mutase/probable phosphoglycerate mutase
MELYLIRHGQSTNNALMEDQLLRVADPELTEIGQQQAEALAQYLYTTTNRDQLARFRMDAPERQQHHPFRFTHLYCSAMHRAMQTTYPIAKALGLKTEIWIDIHEHGGIYLKKDGVTTGYGGRTRTQIMTDYPEFILPHTVTDEGWWTPTLGEEDLASAQGRAIRVAASLKKRATSPESANDCIALVSHGTFMDALLKAMFNNLPSSDYYHAHYNTAVTRIDIRPNAETLLRYLNRIDHLSPELVTA